MSGVTCQDARHLFDAHLDGELSAALETELNAHRLRCSACRHELALLEVAGEVIAADEGAPPLPEEFTARLLACLAERPSPRHLLRPRVLRLGAGLLAAAAGLALAVIYFSRPAPQVAGVRYQAPRAEVTNTENSPADPRAGGPAAAVSPANLQTQLEQALTEWRNNASSLQKMYHFITPQIEEMRRARPEDVHDRPDLFEPSRPDAVPQDTLVPSRIIEDI
jgi:anti-sigma factor RsiW